MLKELNIVSGATPAGFEASFLRPNGKPVFETKALASRKNPRIAKGAFRELIVGIGEFFSGRAPIREVCREAEKSPAKNGTTNEIAVLADSQYWLARIDRSAALHGADCNGLESMRESSRNILALSAPFRDLRAPLKFIRTCLAVHAAQEVR